MKAVKILLSGVILLIMGSNGLAESKLPATKELTDGNTKFAFDLYSELKEKEGNIFFSPYSISTALGMTYAGARGKTEKEMAKVLHFTEGQKQTCKSFRSLQVRLNRIQKRKNIELAIANAIWAQKDYKFLQAYLDIVQKDYKSELKNADFKNPETCEKARLAINGWVEDKTNDKIKDLIAKGMLNAMTRMVLVNAIYFKGDWKLQFKENNTNKNGVFFTSPDKKVNVPMMFQKEEFGYGEDKSTQILDLPYKGREASMIVLLPKAKDGIDELEKSLTIEKLHTLMRKRRKQKVEVYLPKFKAETEFELSKTLQEMGMKDALGMSADFSGITGAKDLFISKVIHKAFVEVDEKGTEAAVATAVLLEKTSMPRRPAVFKADHPFIFMIFDNSTGSMLFIGRVSDPSK